MNAYRVWVTVCVLVGLLAVPAAAVNIETVPVGNVNNVADTDHHSGNPAGQGSVSYTYNIGKYEVTAGQYTEFLNAVAGVDIYGLYRTNMSNTSSGCGIMRDGSGTVSNPYAYSVTSIFACRPVQYVSFWDACRFANWLHNGQPTGPQGEGTTETGAYTLTRESRNNNTVVRNSNWAWAVTSEDEWYKAAYYKGGSTSAGYWNYPTRNDTAPGRDMTDASGNNANYYGPGDYPIDSGKYYTVVGEFQNSESPYGTFDQGGNVWEWNEAVVDVAYRGARGGAAGYGAGGVIELHSSSRIGWGPDGAGSGVGFRVVQVPEPATFALLALGGLGVFGRRRT